MISFSLSLQYNVKVHTLAMNGTKIDFSNFATLYSA